MKQPYEKRVERLSEQCIRNPDTIQCNESYLERLSILEMFRRSRIDFEVFTAPIRFMIAILLLKLEAVCVCEIQYALNEPRQTLVSHHLREMKKKGWLKGERRGKWKYYSLADKKREQFQSMLSSVLEE